MLLLASDGFLFSVGVATRPAVHLLCQESSRCSVNVTGVRLNLQAPSETVIGLVPRDVTE